MSCFNVFPPGLFTWKEQTEAYLLVQVVSLIVTSNGPFSNTGRMTTCPLTFRDIPPEYAQEPPQPYLNLPSWSTCPVMERIWNPGVVEPTRLMEQFSPARPTSFRLKLARLSLISLT